jgi:PAS domain S-box-containing protein
MGKSSSTSGKGKMAVSTDDFDLSLYKDLVESAPFPIWIKDLDNRIIKFSKAAAQLHGKKAGQMEGRSLDSILPKKLADLSRKEDREIIRSKKPLLDIRHTYPPEGKESPLVIRLKKIPILDRKGNVTHIVVYGNDITGQQEIVKREAKYKEVRNKIVHVLSDALVASMSLNDFYGLVHTGLSEIMPADDLCIALYNKEDKSFTCSFCARDEGKSVRKKRMDCGMLQFTMKSMQPVLLSRDEFRAIIREKKLKHTGEIPLWWMGIPMRGGNDYLGIITLSVNSEDQKFDNNALETAILVSNLVAVAISKKNTEENLAQQLDFLNSLMDNFPDLIYVKDKESRFLRFSKTYAKRLKLSDPGKIAGKTDFDIFNDAHARDAFEDEQQIIRTGIPLIGKDELEIWPGGERRWSNSSKMPWHNAAGEIMGTFGISYDITARKQAETEIQESRRKLAETNQMLNLIINTIPIRIFWKSKDSVFLGCNIRFAEDAGYKSPGELTGKTDFDMPWEDQAEAYCMDDKEVMDKAESKMNYEEIQTNAEGSQVWLLTSKVPLRNMEDEIIGVLGTYDDITTLKAKEAELKSKNEELERFTYTVSHDLKSPLVTIKGFVGLLEEDIASGDAENVRINISRIKSAADKMSNLLNNLLELSRIGQFNNPFVKVSMDKILRDTLDSISGIIEQKNVQIIPPGSMPEVFVDSQRMAEVWQNLIENSVKFMGDQSRPVVEIGFDSADKFQEFYIRDNGIGIEEKYFDTVFGLFNKLDNKSEGTGFGLALVKRIVEIHGGTIRVESAGKGLGSTFRFTLPKLKRK